MLSTFIDVESDDVDCLRSNQVLMIMLNDFLRYGLLHCCLWFRLSSRLKSAFARIPHALKSAYESAHEIVVVVWGMRCAA